ncbi:MAG: hypothetical protein ACI8WB_001233 [Phenylobacterium sp.]|jgi:hypothetical protein
MIKTINKSQPAAGSGGGSGTSTANTASAANKAKPTSKASAANATNARNGGGLSSSINGSFQQTTSTAVEQSWSLRHDKAQNAVCLAVSVSAVAELSQPMQYFESTLGLDEINQLVNWLFQARKMIQKQATQ